MLFIATSRFKGFCPIYNCVIEEQVPLLPWHGSVIFCSSNQFSSLKLLPLYGAFIIYEVIVNNVLRKIKSPDIYWIVLAGYLESLKLITPHYCVERVRVNESWVRRTIFKLGSLLGHQCHLVSGTYSASAIITCINLPFLVSFIAISRVLISDNITVICLFCLGKRKTN